MNSLNSWYYKVYNYEDLLLNLTYYDILVNVTKDKSYTYVFKILREENTFISIMLDKLRTIFSLIIKKINK